MYVCGLAKGVEPTTCVVHFSSSRGLRQWGFKRGGLQSRILLRSLACWQLEVTILVSRHFYKFVGS